MSNVNNSALSGNLTADPELKIVGDDFAICNLRLAVNRSKKQGDEYVEEVSYFDLTVLGGFAKLVDRKARKGDSIAVSGRLEQQRWEKDGEKKSKVVLIVNELDGACMYRKDEDVKAKAEGSSSPATSSPSSPAPADDDIPF